MVKYGNIFYQPLSAECKVRSLGEIAKYSNHKHHNFFENEKMQLFPATRAPHDVTSERISEPEKWALLFKHFYLAAAHVRI